MPDQRLVELESRQGLPERQAATLGITAAAEGLGGFQHPALLTERTEAQIRGARRRGLPRPAPLTPRLARSRGGRLRRGQGRALGHDRDELAHPGDDIAIKVFGLALTLLHILEPLLPARRQLRAAQGLRHQADEGQALGGRPQLFPLPLHIAAPNELFDDGGAGSRCAQAGLLHGRRQGIVLDLAPGALHGRQQGRVIVGAWGLGLFFHDLQAGDLNPLTGGQERQDRLLVLAPRQAPGGLHPLPAGIQDPGTAGDKVGAADIQDDMRFLHLFIGQEDGDKARHHQLEDPTRRLQ